MKPASFRYIAAQSVAHALEVKREHGDDARFLAGGQSLVPAMNFRLAQPAVLIDLNPLRELDYVRGNGSLVIGALVRHRTIERDGSIAAHAPLLAEAAPHVAHPQIRNRGTLCGNLAHADPASEFPAVMLAVGARLRAQSAAGARWIEAGDFFQGVFTTALAPDEMLVEVEIPGLPARTGTCFLEVARRRGDYALVGVGVVVTADANGRFAAARIALCNAGATPVLVETTDLEGAPDQVRRAIDPPANVHATAEFRRHLAGVLTQRALRTALERATGREGVLPSSPRRGAGAAGGVVRPASTTPAPRATPPDQGGKVAVALVVNGTAHTRAVEPRLLLSDFIRHELGLTGTHVGCEHGVCGACTVLVDGQPMRSCLMFAPQANGCELTTVEGLAPARGALSPLQEAFRDAHGLQCGYCTPGILTTMKAFLDENPHPTEPEIRDALSGNLCRCTGYQHIVDAVLLAARTTPAAVPPPLLGEEGRTP
jgi:CO/xanthine dehydrogenase FAD-binding subunit/aerobic-type carbon monoxide dehydrogenase small subunit (CoxS/CutS family)